MYTWIRTFIAIAALAVVGIVATTSASRGFEIASASTDIPANPQIVGIEKWLNSEPLTLQQTRGKVVLVDFWTYSCVNCLNTLPYVKDWDQKYRNQGLTVIGVHTPEYPFERDAKNVSAAVNRLGIRYPVALDNQNATWNAFNNQYWPAVYLFDKQGRIVYSHFGEGDYAKTEAKIRELLAKAN